MAEVNNYKDLIIWQKAMDLVVAVYALTNQYPREEKFGLVGQTRRSAVSVPSNIAEGRGRGSRKDYRHFLTVAYASGLELETQVEIAKRVPFSKNLDFVEVESLLLEVLKMLNSAIHTLKPNP